MRLVRDQVERYLNEAFVASVLADLNIKIRYVPIVMDNEARLNYPARSKARLKEKIYDCAPQLAYQPFIVGNWSEQVCEYLLGLNGCCEGITKFGATDGQVAKFKEILRQAYVDLTKDKKS